MSPLGEALCRGGYASVLLSNAVFFVILLFKHAFSRAAIVRFDDIVLPVGLWAAAAISLFAILSPALRGRLRREFVLPGVLLSLGMCAFAVGETTWSCYELIKHRETPFPSLADAGYLLSYPLFLTGVMLIPTENWPRMRRTRLILDGVIVLGALCTFSWYFVLGPTFLAASESALAKWLGLTYPCGDLLLLFYVYILWFRADQTALRPAAQYLALGLISFVVADTGFCYLTLKGSYQTGSLVDILWPAGFLLMARSIWKLSEAGCRAESKSEAARGSAEGMAGPADDSGEPLPPAGSSMRLSRFALPYVVVALSWALLVYAHNSPADDKLEPGLYLGAGVVAVLVVLRQLLSLQENAALNRRLHAAYAALGDKTERLHALNKELEVKNRSLQSLATTDGLTGLFNHRTFHERLREEVDRSLRHGRPLSLTLLDVDRFKQYNDVYGHPSGGVVLRRVASLLRESARSADILARYGGEEFAVIMPETDREGARRGAERLRAAVQNAEWPDRAITISVGISTSMGGAATSAEMITAADLALYRSKRGGRNRVMHIGDALPEFRGDIGVTYSQLIEQLTNAEHGEIISAFERIRDILSESYDVTVESWSRLLELRHKENEGHSERVTAVTVALAKRIRMNPEEVMYVRWGALLHDIGKVGVPDEILRKEGALSEEEWEVMRTHATIARDMLWPVAFLRPALDIPHAHHERWDGMGYPRGLAGDDIPLAARLFAVVDVWDALSHDRPYQSAWPLERVRQHLLDQSGKHFDPRAVKVFLELLDDGDARERLLGASLANAA